MDKYIREDEVIKTLEELQDAHEHEMLKWAIRTVKRNAIKSIKEIPTADVRPVVRGEWVERKDVAPFKPDGEITSWTYRCSKCEELSRLKYNFCPNCGAEMLPT